MSAGAIRAGGAYVELFTKDGKLEQGLAKAQLRLQAFAASTSRIGGTLMGLGAAAAAPFALAIKSASDLEETMSKFEVVFGERSAEVKQWGDDFAAQVGRGKREVAGFLAASQDLFVPLGFDPRQAEELSKTLTTLAADLGSFNNRADADVMNDLQAALTGSGEVMKKYGVIVSETTVKQEMLNRGLDPANASETQKVMSRLNIILRGTTAAQGDALRTADGFANQMKRLQGVATDAAESIGAALLPAVTQLVSKASAFVGSLQSFASVNQTLVQAVAGSAVGVFGLGVALKAASFAAGTLSGACRLVSGTLGVLRTVATATAVVMGRLATVMTTQVIPSLLAWGSRAADVVRSMTMMQLGSLALKTALVGLAIAGVALLVTNILQAHPALEGFRQQLRKINAEAGAAATAEARLAQNTLRMASEITDAGERQKFLNAELAKAEPALQAAIRSQEQWQRKVDSYGSIELLDYSAMKRDEALLEAATQRVETLTEFVANLKDESAAAGRELGRLKGSGAPGAVAPGMPSGGAGAAVQPPAVEPPRQPTGPTAADLAPLVDRTRELWSVGDRLLADAARGADPNRTALVADRLGNDLAALSERLRDMGQTHVADRVQERSQVFEDLSRSLAATVDPQALRAAADAFHDERAPLIDASERSGRFDAAAGLADAAASTAEAQGRQLAAEFFRRRAEGLRERGSTLDRLGEQQRSMPERMASVDRATNSAMELGSREALQAIVVAVSPERRHQQKVEEYAQRSTAAAENTARQTLEMRRRIAEAPVVTAGRV